MKLSLKTSLKKNREKENNGITSNRKMSYMLVMAALATTFGTWLAPDGYFKEAMENDFIKSLKQKLTAYNNHSPEERLYLQSDKPFYEPGDDIWFACYIREGETLKPSGKSDVVYAELINPKGAVEKKLSLIGHNGKASGDFSLPKEAVGGLYKIKAYTSWMRNENSESCFEKEIQVQEVVLPNLKMKLDFERKAFGAGDQVIARLELNSNENKPLADYKIKYVASVNGQKIIEQADMTDADGMRFIKFNLPKALTSNDGLLNVMIDYNGSTESISRSIPIILNKINFTMYPEGGNLVYGLDNNVAFRALNEFGKPADVEGIVLTEKGSKVATLGSYHMGMGAFRMAPQQGEKYRVKITKPEGVKEEFDLPEPLERGYTLGIDNTKPGELGAEINSTETGELALVAQVRGKIYYTTVVNVLASPVKISLPTNNMPAGVCQLTLFDAKGIARAERLSFVNRDKQLKISIETDKEKYLPREKVKMTVSVKDERGLPMPANLSMAVVNDQLLSFADDKSGNILSQLLLQQDIKEKIEEPAFYFDKKENKSAKALDYLMMTAGWRRFAWEKLLTGDLPQIKFPSEKAVVSGVVYNAADNKPFANAKIQLSNGTEYKTDESGKYSITKLDLVDPVSLTFSSEGFYPQTYPIAEYNQNFNVTLYKYTPRSEYEVTIEQKSYKSMPSMMSDAMQIQLCPASSGQPDVHKAPRLEFRKNKSGGGKKAEVNAERVEKKEAPAKADQEGEKDLAMGNGGMKLDEVELVVGDARGAAFAKDIEMKPANQLQPQATRYYRVRQFSAPAYEKQENVETRTDFRNTIYWNPDIEIGFSGKKTIEFYTSDNITSFRTTVEGIATDGMLGRAEKNFFTQLPFALTTKIPVEVATEDILSLPVTLKNNTDGPLGGLLTVEAPVGLQELEKIPSAQTVMPGKAKTIYLNYKVLDKIGSGEFNIGFKACGLSDAFTQQIKMVPKGFPVQASFSGQDKEKEYEFNIANVVNGSLRASFNAYPNVVSDLMKGVEGILQEPYGCFEQTSCTAYPNAMVLDYLKNTDSRDSKTLARATDLLDRGYKRLTTFETPAKGYEWFGANPAHEGLTAYGIMEFVDMKKAGQEIDQRMLDRTAQWLLNHKDGKGGFEREKRALHDFGRISDDILNAYIVYALAESGYTDLKKEFESSYQKAISSGDAYMLAMMTNAAFSMKEERRGEEALKALLAKQDREGSFTGSTHSITYSQGRSLTIETTALSVMSILKSKNKDMKALDKAIGFLVNSRSGSGVFSSTQGTILALKSLTEYAKFSKRASEDGTIDIYVDGKKVAERSYKAGDKAAITVDGIEGSIKGEGKHKLSVKYHGTKNPLPYSVALNWNTFLPASDTACSIDLKTKLSSKAANVGETVRLTATITNKRNSGVPSTMAIIGIPAGLSVQPWQLKELQEKQIFDYYEIKGNNIAVYYRCMAPNAVKIINLDLKAEIPGEYDAPASSAYLYYTNEFKTWGAVDKIIIKKTNNS